MRPLLDWYYLAFPNDKWAFKTIVAFTYVLETMQTLIMTVDCFNTYAIGFGNVDLLNNPQHEWLAVPMITGIGTCLGVIGMSLITQKR